MPEDLVQSTLVILKPDALARRLIGRLISRLEDKEIDITAAKMLQLDKRTAELLYAQHSGKYFCPRLIRFICSGPILALVCRGRQAVERVRRMVGTAAPETAEPGTIRSDFSCHQTYNLIHASDNPDAADREIRLLFSEAEIWPQLTARFPWHDYPEITEP